MNLFKQKILIYGINQQAQQLYQLIKEENAAEICGFIVDEGYKKSEFLFGKRVYEFNKMLKKKSPQKYQIVLSFGYKNMVKNRQKKYNKCCAHGYSLFTYISKRAVVYTKNIGEGSIIYPNVFLGPFTSIGKGCFLENGVSIAHHSQCGDFVFFAPNGVVCGGTIIKDNCFVGANAVITNGLRIAERTLVSAGAKLSQSTETGTICFPAKGFLTQEKEPEVYI